MAARSARDADADAPQFNNGSNILPLPPALAAAVDASGPANFFHYKGILYVPIDQRLSRQVFPTPDGGVNASSQKTQPRPVEQYTQDKEEERHRDDKREDDPNKSTDDKKYQDDDVVFVSDSRHILQSEESDDLESMPGTPPPAAELNFPRQAPLPEKDAPVEDEEEEEEVVIPRKRRVSAIAPPPSAKAASPFITNSSVPPIAPPPIVPTPNVEHSSPTPKRTAPPQPSSSGVSTTYDPPSSPPSKNIASITAVPSSPSMAPAALDLPSSLLAEKPVSMVAGSPSPFRSTVPPTLDLPSPLPCTKRVTAMISPSDPPPTKILMPVNRRFPEASLSTLASIQKKAPATAPLPSKRPVITPTSPSDGRPSTAMLVPVKRTFPEPPPLSISPSLEKKTPATPPLNPSPTYSFRSKPFPEQGRGNSRNRTGLQGNSSLSIIPPKRRSEAGMERLGRNSNGNGNRNGRNRSGLVRSHRTDEFLRAQREKSRKNLSALQDGSHTLEMNKEQPFLGAKPTRAEYARDAHRLNLPVTAGSSAQWTSPVATPVQPPPVEESYLPPISPVPANNSNRNRNATRKNCQVVPKKKRSGSSYTRQRNMNMKGEGNPKLKKTIGKLFKERRKR